jgi:hypothetical protein
MVPSPHHPKKAFQTGITVAAAIECLNRAEILPPGNTGFSMRREENVFFPCLILDT